MSRGNLATTDSAGASIAIGIGANLGDAADTVKQAIQALRSHAAISAVTASSLYASAPIDSDGPNYVNAVVTANTDLTPEHTLQALLAIETIAGRERPYKNAPRTLDLDLLLYDSVQMDTPTLTLPHPRMHLRAFVLIPLAQISPDRLVPGHGRVADLVHHVKDQSIRVMQ